MGSRSWEAKWQKAPNATVPGEPENMGRVTTEGLRLQACTLSLVCLISLETLSWCVEEVTNSPQSSLGDREGHKPTHLRSQSPPHSQAEAPDLPGFLGWAGEVASPLGESPH